MQIGYINTQSQCCECGGVVFLVYAILSFIIAHAIDRDGLIRHDIPFINKGMLFCILFVLKIVL